MTLTKRIERLEQDAGATSEKPLLAFRLPDDLPQADEDAYIAKRRADAGYTRPADDGRVIPIRRVIA